MADKKISALTPATTPLAGTEVLPIVQSGSTVKVSVDNLTIGKAVTVGSLTDAGNLTFTGTGNRITGDFTNATLANRVAIQTSTANSATEIYALPSGTNNVGIYAVANASDPTNASRGLFGIFGDALRIYSDINGTGTYLPIRIFTGGSERVRVDTSGNFGIGTTSPDANLTVNGVSSFAAGTALLPSIARSSDLNTGLWFPAADTIAASTGGNERIRLTSSGRLGIGTTAPESPLVVSNGGAAGFEFFANYPGGGVGTYFQSFNRSGGAYVDTAYDAASHSFRTNGTERMRIDAAGGVGIGTSSPLTSAKQTIVFESGGSVSQAMTLISYGGNPTISFRQASGTIASPGASNSATLNFIGSTTDDGTNFFNTSQILSSLQTTATAGSHPTFISFSTTPSGSTSRSERMRIDPSGAVGIGTNSPNASAILDAQSTTRGVRFPNMDTTQKNAIATPAAGLVVFDTTLAKLCVYSGAAWQTITSV